MSLIDEIWRDIDGYNGKYQISNYGRVKSLKHWHGKKDKILKIYSGTRYNIVVLCTNSKLRSFMIHRLVAKAFIPNNENKENVNHIDNDTHNNYYKNLEWATQKENIYHSINQDRFGKILNKYDVNMIRNLRKSFGLLGKDLVRIMGYYGKVISKQQIFAINRNATWKNLL